MSSTPDFIEFAAIQIFSAMVDKDNPGRVGIANAGYAWELAKMLYDAKPADDECVLGPSVMTGGEANGSA